MKTTIERTYKGEARSSLYFPAGNVMINFTEAGVYSTEFRPIQKFLEEKGYEDITDMIKEKNKVKEEEHGETVEPVEPVETTDTVEKTLDNLPVKANTLAAIKAVGVETLEELKLLSFEEIVAIKGVSETSAKAVYVYVHDLKDEADIPMETPNQE